MRDQSLDEGSVDNEKDHKRFKTRTDISYAEANGDRENGKDGMQSVRAIRLWNGGDRRRRQGCSGSGR